MDEKQKLVFGAAAILGGSLIVAAYLAAPPRYALAMSDRLALRLDRSTGSMAACLGLECRPLVVHGESWQQQADAAAASNSALADNALQPKGDEWDGLRAELRNSN